MLFRSDPVDRIVAGVHAETIAVQRHRRDALPCEGVGIAAPDIVDERYAFVRLF